MLKGHRRPWSLGLRPKQRPRLRSPSSATKLRVRYLEAMVEMFGPAEVASWQDAPVSLEEWARSASSKRVALSG